MQKLAVCMQLQTTCMQQHVKIIVCMQINSLINCLCRTYLKFTSHGFLILADIAIQALNQEMDSFTIIFNICFHYDILFSISLLSMPLTAQRRNKNWIVIVNNYSPKSRWLVVDIY